MLQSLAAWTLAVLAIDAAFSTSLFAGTVEFPARPIRLITAGSPGSTPDTVARPLAAKLGLELKQPVIVDNRPGAAGILAMNLVAQAKPDGYTIGVAAMSQLVFNSFLFSRLSYDPARDFVPLIRLVAGKVVLAAHPSLPANSLTELIALARAQPGKIDYAVPQLGAPPHVFALMAAREANIDLVAVPYRSASEALAGVISGTVPLLFEVPYLVAPHVRNKSLKAIAVIGRERDRLLPETPTFAESGLPDATAEAWIGLVFPANTPSAIVNAMNAAVSRALRSSELKQHFDDLGWRIVGGSPADFASAIEHDRVVWGSIIRAAGIKLD